MSTPLRDHAASRGFAQSGFYLVAVLTVANAVTFVDRQVLTLLLDPVREHLGVRDAQMGLLQGPAFALFYAFVGLFLGRLVDRANRIRLLLAGLASWSVAVAAVAFVDSFAMTFVARTAAGIGEAVLTPAAASLVADRVAPDRRARAMSAFVGGQSLGAGLAMIGAGALVATLEALAGADGEWYALAPWQWAFVACAALAVPLLLLVLPIREPPRTDANLDARPDAPARSVADGARAEAPTPVERSELRARIPTLAALMLAFCLLGVVGWGAGGWLPTYLMRRFELGIGVVGPAYGAILAVCAPLGALAGGSLADALKRRGRTDAAVWVGLAGVIGLCGAVIATVRMPDPASAWLAVAAYNFFAPFPFGTVYAAIADATPSAYRGQAVAVYGLGLNVFGFGLGATTVGFATDRLFGGPAGLGDSLTLLAVAYGTLAAIAFLAVRPAYGRLVARL